MKILVVPDVHLKTWIFDQADNVSPELYDNIVILGDLVDDWGQQSNIEAYQEVLDRALAFSQDHPDSLWCYGNHDLSYMYDFMETGYSLYARGTVCDGLEILENELQNRLQVIHKIDTTLFSHAGLSLKFLNKYCSHLGSDLDFLLTYINDMPKAITSAQKLWDDFSPLWIRPDQDTLMYPASYLQVTGHTPVKTAILLDNNVLMLDNMSTHRDGTPIGDQALFIIDTITHEVEMAAI